MKGLGARARTRAGVDPNNAESNLKDIWNMKQKLGFPYPSTLNPNHVGGYIYIYISYIWLGFSFGFWLAGDEGMDKTMDSTRMHSLIPP